MTHRAALYGLVIESDVSLPGVSVERGAAGVDVRVHLDARPADATRWPDAPVQPFYRSEPADGEPPSLVADRPADGIVRLTYGEGVRFHVRADGSEVWSDWEASLRADDAMTYLLGPVLGFVLRCRGVLAVHASAVELGGAAWGFVGAGGAGKSTMAAALARAGHPVLTDDVLALRSCEGRWMAWPAYDHLRLWEDSPALPPSVGPALPPLSASYEKRALDLATAGLPRATAPLPLTGWFALDEAAAGAPPHVRRLGGSESLRTLVQHSYVGYLLDGVSRAAELRALAEVARATVGYQLEVADGRSGLDSTVRLVRRIAAHGGAGGPSVDFVPPAP